MYIQRLEMVDFKNFFVEYFIILWATEWSLFGYYVWKKIDSVQLFQVFDRKCYIMIYKYDWLLKIYRYTFAYFVVLCWCMV